MCKKKLVLGCGNILLGDDGFGSIVANHLLKNYNIEEDTIVVDVGTSIRDILFDMLLSGQLPDYMIIVDSVQFRGRAFGEIFEIDTGELPEVKIPDYSLHQFPSVNMIKELKENFDIKLKVFVVQAEHIPVDIKPGLSPTVKASVPKMCDMIIEQMNRFDNSAIKQDKKHADI